MCPYFTASNFQFEKWIKWKGQDWEHSKCQKGQGAKTSQNRVFMLPIQQVREFWDPYEELWENINERVRKCEILWCQKAMEKPHRKKEEEYFPVILFQKK